MLNGCYMVHTISRGGVRAFRVYDQGRHPVLSIKERTARNLSDIWLFKKDKQHRYTINLQLVRTLRNNTWIKMQYKQSSKK